MDRYPIEELKVVYRVLHRHLIDHTELLDAQFFEDLQRHLQRHALADGIDIADHGAWDEWLGNTVVSCEERMRNRAIID